MVLGKAKREWSMDNMLSTIGQLAENTDELRLAQNSDECLCVV